MLKNEADGIIHKTREDYNRIAKYFSGTRYDVWPELEQFKKYVKDGFNVLDWGCGNGRLVLMLKDKKINYFGLDQSDELLKIARKKFGKEKWVRFFSTAKKDKKFNKDFFDAVFMIASFHHLPDLKNRLDLLKKIFIEMKKGGALIITVWNLVSDWAKEKINKEWKQTGKNDFLIPWKNPEGKVLAERYYHHFSKEELGGLLKDVGFKILKLDFYEKNNWTDKKDGRNLVAIAVK